MKLLVSILTFIFLSTAMAPVEAGAVKEIYTVIHEEIEFYYQATGDWQVVKVAQLEFIPADNYDYILVSAVATIQNVHTGQKSKETCLVTFDKMTHDFHSITCF